MGQIMVKIEIEGKIMEQVSVGLNGKNIQMVKIEIEGKIIERDSNFNYLGHLISNEENYINIKPQRYNKMNGIIKCHFG
jgi:hypothetical protein